jgi:Ca2+-binding RTX toxin-like protein
MATVTAYYPSDFSFQNAWFLEIPAQTFNSTSATVAFGYHQMNMTGVGIAFPLNALPTGTITGSSIYGLDANGVLALHVVTTGLNYNFTSFVNTLHPAGAAATPASYLAAMGLMFTAADTFNGSTGNDVIYSFGGNDILRGNAGNDILEGGVGNDTINGGVGIDTASYSTATAAVTVNLGLASAQTSGGAGIDTLSAIENLLGSNFNDTLLGNSGANNLNGAGGADVLKGAAGNDILSGGIGNDI